MHQTELSCFYRILDLLKQKYTDTNDFNFVEQGIRCNLQNYNNLNLAISNISSYIFNFNNENLLKDLLNSIYTGINYQLANHQDNLEKLIIENTNITVETGNTINCIQEHIKDLL
jgi:frataxin-like iron-binding protein CyaY